MELKTFDTILTTICDSFDSLIAPRTIARSNTNIIYLIFKAAAKGYEIINNVCVVLSNKFDPLYCSEDDLISSANIVGTERHKGSATGLHITVTNNGSASVTLLAGLYTYALDDDTKFEFEVMENTVIASGSHISFIAMSEKIGRYPVTAQTTITVTSEQPVSSDLVFSCTDNATLLGISEETDLEFRERINSKTDRQNSMVELESEIRNLPYIFDCKVKFNPMSTEIEFEGYTIPAYTLAIFYSGEVKKEIAEKVCEKIICPTLQTADSVEVFYENDVFVGGKHGVNLIPFAKTQYAVELIYKINKTYANEYDIQNEIRTVLFNTFVSEKHVDYIKEDDFYNAVEALGITGIELLGVNLKYNNSNVNYIEIPSSRIPELTNVIFTPVSQE